MHVITKIMHLRKTLIIHFSEMAINITTISKPWTRVPFMFTGDEVAAPIYISIGRCVREERKDR